MSDAQIKIEGINLTSFLGLGDSTLRKLEKTHPEVQFFVRGNEINLSGPHKRVADAAGHIENLIDTIKTEGQITERDLSGQKQFTEPILLVRGRAIKPQTAGQRSYVQAIDTNTITFGIGPAGTGKTYLAVAKAVAALQARRVSKIILTRPAVEAGERLGYLPGTLSEKIDPYLRPLFDAAASMLEPEVVGQLLASGAIEVAPLAYMRGRTLNESFVILDEAQNTTPDQMKMFLTRLGYQSQMVVTGDLTQADLPGGASGLKMVTKVLHDVDDISFQELTSDDIVRHSLVSRIVDAYDRFEKDGGKQK